MKASFALFNLGGGEMILVLTLVLIPSGSMIQKDRLGLVKQADWNDIGHLAKSHNYRHVGVRLWPVIMSL